ncbi:MAG TPA: XdhC/CoxI family protein [Pyrinomonadaceae bacterium]|nr:XdhC/CoxI family protein [Pyrinomonadaceae bacterium]
MSRLIIEAVERVLQENSLAALATIIRAPSGMGAKILITEDGARTGTLNSLSLDEAAAHYAQKFLASRAETRTLSAEELSAELGPDEQNVLLMFERIENEPSLVICGAGHVGAHLARLAHLAGYRATLIDDRADFVTRERFPEAGIELVAARSWTEALESHVGRGSYVAVVTRGHNEDEECMRAVLQARPRYVGMIGSKRRTNIVLERLREQGFDEEVLREVRAPIGLDIGAVSPEEVALAVLSEIVAERRGGTGQPLSAWRRGQKRERR